MITVGNVVDLVKLKVNVRGDQLFTQIGMNHVLWTIATELETIKNWDALSVVTETGVSFRCTKCGYTINGDTNGGSSCTRLTGPLVTCPTCNGSGKGSQTTCSACKGSGSTSTTITCPTCEGDKTVTITGDCDHGCSSTHYYCPDHGNDVSEYHRRIIYGNILYTCF